MVNPPNLMPLGLKAEAQQANYGLWRGIARSTRTGLVEAQTPSTYTSPYDAIQAATAMYTPLYEDN